MPAGWRIALHLWPGRARKEVRNRVALHWRLCGKRRDVLEGFPESSVEVPSRLEGAPGERTGTELGRRVLAHSAASVSPLRYPRTR